MPRVKLAWVHCFHLALLLSFGQLSAVFWPGGWIWNCSARYWDCCDTSQCSYCSERQFTPINTCPSINFVRRSWSWKPCLRLRVSCSVKCDGPLVYSTQQSFRRRNFWYVMCIINQFSWRLPLSFVCLLCMDLAICEKSTQKDTAISGRKIKGVSFYCRETAVVLYQWRYYWQDSLVLSADRVVKM